MENMDLFVKTYLRYEVVRKEITKRGGGMGGKDVQLRQWLWC